MKEQLLEPLENFVELEDTSFNMGFLIFGEKHILFNSFSDLFDDCIEYENIFNGKLDKH